MCLAESVPNVSVPISNDNYDAETEASSAFDNFTDTIDMDNFFLKFQTFRANALFESHHVSRSLKLQAGFARSFCYRADATMIQEPIPVKHHFANALFLTLLGNEGADSFCRLYRRGFRQRGA